MPLNKDENKIEIIETDVLETELPKESSKVMTPASEAEITAEVSEDLKIQPEVSGVKKKEFKFKNSEVLKKTFALSNFLLGLRLCLIVTAVVLALALVNSFTAPVIDKNQAEKGDVARLELVPSADSFYLYDKEIPEVGKNVSKIYIAEQSGEEIAYCLNITVAGFGGNIDLVVAIDVNMKILGIKIISHSETANIGASALEDEGKLLPQYKNLPISSLDNVIAVSGATVTSSAVKSGVEEAVKVVNALVKGAVSE